MEALGGAENLVELPPERSEQLDWRPSTLFVMVHVRKKYARKTPLPESGLTLAEQNVAVARKPAEAIPGALAGPGLMAQVIVCKGTDHLPLHRQEGIFKRQGMRISRQTMDGWWLLSAEFSAAVVRSGDWRGAGFARRPHGRHFRESPRCPEEIEAHGPLLALRGRRAASAGGVRLHADAQPRRTGRVLEKLSRLLAGRRLQRLRRHLSGIARENCRGGLLVHARRKFHECRRLDAARMETALAWIGKLYAVEKDLREHCQGEWQNLALAERAERIAAERQERSRPLLNTFHAWLEAEAPKVLPKSDVRGAMDYTLNNWAALCVYTEDGWLDIDNNEGENSIRGLCLGRKNWLFLGNDRGGRAAAIHFSLLASCKRHGHDPWAYYRDVLIRLPVMLPDASKEELLALLPHLWKPA